MSSRAFETPWPSRTPGPYDAAHREQSTRVRKRSSLKRKRETVSTCSNLQKRQVVVDEQQVEQALTQCQLLSGNNIISCFPDSNTVVAQHEWISFVWNSRRPEITQANLVDIFLFHGDSRTVILHFSNCMNPMDQAGQINVQVNDSWWGTRGVDWNGRNISYPFYFALIPSSTTLDGNEIAQPTFSAVQTTFADAVATSLAAASSASALSASSASAASVASVESAASAASASASRQSVAATSTSSSSASLQSNSNNGGFPHWAIAVIVVLGFLAIVVTCILVFVLMRRLRRRKSSIESNRNSMGSASPMIVNAGGPSSPLLAGAALTGHAGSQTGHDGQAHSVVTHDGASAISRTGSAANEGPFSGADAAIMADAFRKMLRKPDFAAQLVEEGESPDGPEQDGRGSILGRELAEEGRDIRSVSSERGVRVETLSDSGDTVQDHHKQL